MLWPKKKNSYKEFDNEKIFLRFENSAPLPLAHIRERSVTKTFWAVLHQVLPVFSLFHGRG